jgi:hypothetical protein
MAATAPSPAESFVVQGRIFDALSKGGLGNLLVTAYHVDGQGSDGGPIVKAERRSRVGSVPSDDDGHFQVSYDAADIARLAGDGGRLNLVLVVSAPDDETAKSAEKVIFDSDTPRMRAGRVEHFNIGISRDTLEKFQLHDAPSAESGIVEYERDRTTETELAEGVAKFHEAALHKEIAEKAALRDQLLATVATNLDVTDFPGRVVRGNDRIRDLVQEVAADAVDTATATIDNAEGVPVNLFLVPEDRQRLQPFFDQAVDGFVEIPESELASLLDRVNSSENPGTLLINHNPIARYCATRSTDELCAAEHTGLAGGHEHDENDGGGGGAGANGGPVTDGSVRDLVGRLLADVTAPDFVFGDDLAARRATKADVTASVESFALERGPADTPAFYDFHSLQIAFEHVWKVLVDEEVVNVAHRLDLKHRQKTGLPFLGGFTHGWTDAVSVLDAYEAALQEVPADVSAQFEITLQEWIDLSATHRARLFEIARKLADTEGERAVRASVMLPGTGTTISVPVSVPASRFGSIAFEKQRQDLREQGERIIESVRHDDYYTLHQTLRELQSRLNSAYEFTVFAADRNVHSVNFGLMCTYRQEWTPLNYQPGRLVKTIPLAPKEERKYAFKSTHNAKLVSKEAIKNNRAMATEQSSISRVESEIIAKATNRTNFSLSTEGNYNLWLSKGKATTSFGVDAVDESTASRKDFREAVVKATQEYKEEHSTEVDTEDSVSTEFEASGTIVNPNDELSVTYLFYELQRCYRVSELLYRVMPVVLVAQEVPAPHQITEAWVIANDWIINRVLLDDAFRPALQYLANKSVGDDFGLRELRKNLRQQRNLVETLRIELTIASHEAENRYRALEAAIEKRIGEASAEQTDGWFSDIGDFFGGGGQDPEAAKARELAAKDAHQYAADKAEKAAAALQRETNQLHELTTAYNGALRDHLDNETRIKRLLVHIRNNIFHYMQAIWSMEPPDQRLLRLHRVDVPQLELETIPDPHNPNSVVADRRYTVEVEPSPDIFSQFREPGTTKHRAFLRGRIKPVTSFVPRSLVDVADLDNLLGFKGNYMIFPLKEHNALTEFMAAPYVDAAFGAMDPDELGNVSLEDYARYVCCLHDRLPAAEFDALKPTLEAWLKRLLQDPLRNGDEIVVPTDSLFVEALPGTHALLEDFKLRHRELDAYKAAEDVRRAQMENARLADRLLHDEREDPDVEKMVVIRGDVDTTVDVDNP